MLKKSSLLNKFGIVCPICFGQLMEANGTMVCLNCDHPFPLIKGIIDLRIPADQSDPLAEKLLEKYDSASFDELISILLSNAQLPLKIINNTHRYYDEQMKRLRNMTNMFLNQIKISFGNVHMKRAVDIGCGSGAGVVTLGRYFKEVIGLDSSMTQLILAAKTLEKEDRANNILLCANASRLPFKNESVDYIQATNVFEHLKDFQQVIIEISRSLKDMGAFAADSRNRYDIFFPEPHTGIRFLGYLPRKVIPAFVSQIYKSQYENTWLLSYHELRKAMKNNFQGNFLVTFPQIKAYGKPDWIDSWITRISHTPLLKSLFIRIFPTHIVLGKKLG